MPREAAPPWVTGGGGFWFEARVGAFYLAHLLTRIPPLGREGGLIERVDFQNKDGWLFDDIVLHLRHNEVMGRCPISVKSYRQITREGARAVLVRDLWEQYLDAEGLQFDKD